MKKKRELYFDFLNIFATLAVIYLHCNGSVRNYYGDDWGWRQSLGVEVWCFWAVPVFLMISGATLMNYRARYDTKTFLKKRFVKTAIPFLIWSLLAAWDLDLSFSSPAEFIDAIVNTRIENVFWFFIPLFAVYLAMPVVSLLKDQRRILWYMAGGAVLLNSFCPILFGWIGLQWNTALSMLTTGALLCLPILGYLFATTDFSGKQRAVIYLLALLGGGLRYFVIYRQTIAAGEYNGWFGTQGYADFHSVMLACGVFTLFKSFRPFRRWAERDKLSRFAAALAGCSFGVYLSHMIVYRFLANYIQEFSWEWRLLVPLLIYAICVAGTALLKKIPVLKYIVP